MVNPIAEELNNFVIDAPVVGNNKKKKTANIHLPTADLPHDYSELEWWYYNAHLETETGKKYGLFVSFFRLAIGWDEKANAYKFAHSVTWALSDCDNQKYITDSILEKSAPAVGIENIKSGKSNNDKLLEEAILEIFEKGQVPFPDRLSEQEAVLSKEKLALNFDGNTVEVCPDNSYQIYLFHPEENLEIKLNFNPEMAAIKHGNDGIVVGSSGNDMNYYFIPKNKVIGEILWKGNKEKIAGTGWYDHEYAVAEDRKKEVEVNMVHDVSWNWISLQLSNETQLTAYDLFGENKEKPEAGHWSVIIDELGNPKYLKDFSFTPLECWTSTTTFHQYPIKWAVKFPKLGIDLIVEATFPQQEFISLLSEPAFWEGQIKATGTYRGQPVTGNGFIEVSGFNKIRSTKDFLRSVTRETRKSVEKILPLNPTDEQFTKMVASTSNAHFLAGLNKEQYVNTVIKPIREIIDRGGKCWRSFAVMSCIDVVGGNSQDFIDWLAWPELLHTGSLIIDDVQDASTTRRGGPAAHITHGEAIAINAGNAAYFLGQPLLLESKLPIARKLKVYELYFETMRAAHAGQAMDISSFYGMMEEVVESGKADEIEEKILSVHLLKSAVPAGMLARLGGIQGDGSEDQIKYLGLFFESLGLAFQIMDDVLNLRGFDRDLKNKGEDITAGKITMPIVKAMGLLDKNGRTNLWKEVQARHANATDLKRVIDSLEDCGAIDACVQQAEELVETAWHAFEPYIRPSHSSIRMRAFSKFLLKRHY